MQTYWQDGQIKEIDPDLVATWIAAGNTKANGLVVLPECPSHGPLETAHFDGTQWVITAKSAAQIAEDRAGLTCTPYAGEIVLARHGLRQGWLVLLDHLSEEDQVRYARAPRWQRTDPLMDQAIAALRSDLSDPADRAALLDTLFREAAAIDAERGV